MVWEKPDKDLFFIHKDTAEESGSPKPQRLKKRQQNGDSLCPEGQVPSHKRSTHVNATVDSSEDEREYDVSSRYALKKRREKNELAKMAWRRCEKNSVQPIARDLWADNDDGIT